VTQLREPQDAVERPHRSLRARAQRAGHRPSSAGVGAGRLAAFAAGALWLCACSLSIPEDYDLFKPQVGDSGTSDAAANGEGDAAAQDASTMDADVSTDGGSHDGADGGHTGQDAGSDASTAVDAGGDEDAGQDAGPTVFDPTKGLIIHYPFNESSGDTVHNVAGTGDSGHAFMYGKPQQHEAWVSAGRVDGALSLAGGPPPDPDAGIPVGHHVELPQGILLGLDECTIAVWLNRAGGPAWQRVFDFGSGLPNWIYFTPVGDKGLPAVGARTSGGVFLDHKLGELPDASGMLSINKPIPINTWVHFVLTWSAQEVKVYLDGKLVAQAVPAGGVRPTDLGNTTQNYLGWSQFQPPGEFRDPFFQGMLDDFRIYNRVLTSNEVAQLYDSY
jgi:hypothetical protein